MNAVLGEAAINDATIDRVQWLHRDKCPACGGTEQRAQRALIDSHYRFGAEVINFPHQGIDLIDCAICGLSYKTPIPTAESLTHVFERQAGEKWMEPYPFTEEVRELNRLLNPESLDVLDIGSGSGGFLAACAEHLNTRRRSALDLVEHPGGASHVNGEFIRSLIDEPTLTWSRQPYQLATIFDVLEHLYEPTLAFQHLRELVCDNGLVLIETGNVDSEWPRRYGAHLWWYARLFEHHIFWSRQSLEHIAKRFGFKLLIWEERQHKSRAAGLVRPTFTDLCKLGMYHVAPHAYPKIATVFGKFWTQPWSPFTRDHFRAILRKQ